MGISYNSHNLFFKKPFGAVKNGSKVSFRINTEGENEIITVYLMIFSEDVIYKMKKMKGESLEYYECEHTFSEEGLYFYYFKIEKNHEIIFYGNNRGSYGGVGEIFTQEPVKYQLLVYEEQYIPKWFKEGVVYQIFPDRFCRGENYIDCQQRAELPEGFKGAKRIFVEDWNTNPYYVKNAAGEVLCWPFYGGNIKGIISKLDYLKELGIGIIYLNPVFKALSNHKYDTWDYMKIDPSFGDEEDFVRLCHEGKKRGIRVILDGVFNHVGAESPFFDRNNNFGDLGACRGEKSPYYDWFTFYTFPTKYEAWWGILDLPQIKKTQKNYQRYIYKVVNHWISLGAGGFRLDVADELTDEFIQGIRESIKQADNEAVLIGEVWEDASNKMSYGNRKKYFQGKELDGVTNYLFRHFIIDYVMGKINAGDFCKRIYSIYENYPRDNLNSSFNILGSHDRVRIITILGEAPFNLSDEEKAEYKLNEKDLVNAKKRYELALVLLFSLPGLPTVYYGDEFSNQGYEDPYNRGDI